MWIPIVVVGLHFASTTAPSRCHSMEHLDRVIPEGGGLVQSTHHRASRFDSSRFLLHGFFVCLGQQLIQFFQSKANSALGCCQRDLLNGSNLLERQVPKKTKANRVRLNFRQTIEQFRQQQLFLVGVGRDPLIGTPYFTDRTGSLPILAKALTHMSVNSPKPGSKWQLGIIAVTTPKHSQKRFLHRILGKVNIPQPAACYSKER
jgi:hypothetical protein